MSDLREAIRMIERGRTGRALGLLLELWPAHRCPELAEQIERLSARMQPAVAPLPGGQPAWMERYQQRQPADLDALLADLDATSKQLKQRFDATVELPADPRTTRPLLDWAAGMLHGSTAWGKVYTALFKVAAKAGDPRMYAGLEQHRQARIAVQYGTDPIVARIDRLLERFPDQGLPPEGLDALGRAIDALDGPGQVYPEQADPTEDIRQAIYAAPEDDGAIEVWADQLQQAGDPLGVWVALQLEQDRRGLTRREEAQEKRLRKAHQVRILGDLAPVVDPKTARFRRGLLVRARLKEPIDHPALAALEQVHTTARDLRSGRYPRVTRFGMCLAPTHEDRWDAPRGFERLEVVPPGWSHLQELAGGDPLPLTAISVALPRNTPTRTHLRRLDGPGLPHLQELHLYRKLRYDDTLESMLGLLLDHPILRVKRLVLPKRSWKGTSFELWERTRQPGECLVTLLRDGAVEIWEDERGLHAEVTGRGPTGGRYLVAQELGDPLRYTSVTVRAAPGSLSDREGLIRHLEGVPEVVLPK